MISVPILILFVAYFFLQSPGLTQSPSVPRPDGWALPLSPLRLWQVMGAGRELASPAALGVRSPRSEPPRRGYILGRNYDDHSDYRRASLAERTSGKPNPRFSCYPHRLGARTFVPNLGQLAGRPPHWDWGLDESPVVTAGLSIRSRQRRHFRLPAVALGAIGCSFPPSTFHGRNCGPRNSIRAVDLADPLLNTALP